MISRIVSSEVISCHFSKKHFILSAANEYSYCFNREINRHLPQLILVVPSFNFFIPVI